MERDREVLHQSLKKREERHDPILGQAREDEEGARRHRQEQTLGEGAALVNTHRAFTQVPGLARHDCQPI